MVDGRDDAAVFVHSPWSEIDAFAGDIETVVLQPLPFCQKLVLRGDSSNQSWTRAIESVTGLKLPVKPNTITRSGDDISSLFWLGPDEWLFRAPPPSSADSFVDVNVQVNAIRQATADQHSAVVDVSDYYCLLELSGANALDVLEKGTPLNVREVLASPDHCAQTRFGQASILLNRVQEDDAIHIQVRASFARYLWMYLSEASVEFMA